MTNYYERFKLEIDSQVKNLTGAIKTLSADLPRIRQRLESEKGECEGLKKKILALKLTTGEVYADQVAYATFKVDLQKHESELNNSEEVIRMIGADVLPKKQRELDLARANLKILLDTFLLKSRPVADKAIDEHIIACINERQSFLDDFKRIYSDYGLDLIISDESFCPGRLWNQDQIRDMRLRLGMDSPVKEPPMGLQDEQTPELNQIEPGAEICHE